MRWHVASEDGQVGPPMSADDVAAGIRLGAISEHARVCCEGGDQWASIGAIPEFAASFHARVDTTAAPTQPVPHCEAPEAGGDDERSNRPLVIAVGAALAVIVLFLLYAAVFRGAFDKSGGARSSAARKSETSSPRTKPIEAEPAPLASGKSEASWVAKVRPLSTNRAAFASNDLQHDGDVDTYWYKLTFFVGDVFVRVRRTDSTRWQIGLPKSEVTVADLGDVESFASQGTMTKWYRIKSGSFANEFALVTSGTVEIWSRSEACASPRPLVSDASAWGRVCP